MSNDPTPLNQEITCIKAHIVTFLNYRLKNDLITQKRAAQLAQASLDKLITTLSHEQVHQIIDQFKLDFPELSADLDSASAACETVQAREMITQQILTQINPGNIDQALAQLSTFNLR